MSITIRKGTKTDLSAVHLLVHELAVYEKAPLEHTATITDYERDFEAGWLETLIAEQDHKVVGMMLFHHAYSSWKGRMLYLDDFVVTASHRRKGIGELLFAELMNVARQKQVRLIKWQVLDWNEPAIRFYKKYPVIFETDWWNVKIKLT